MFDAAYGQDHFQVGERVHGLAAQGRTGRAGARAAHHAQGPPKAEEVIAYGIPAYRLHGRRVLYFAGWKQHYSLYPATDRLVAAFKYELAPYEVSKGTIRFPLSEVVPVKLIEGIARFRAKEAAEREKTKPAVSKKR
jgi:uncharacterized protein YdhG (YjbR/CyaY superfamily)